MLFIVGVVVLFGSILGGFLPHGKLEVLMQPLEVLIICGCALAGFIIANPKDVIIGVIKGLVTVIKGGGHDKQSYLDLLTLLYTLLRMAKAKGPLALEEHAEHPDESSIFAKFPEILANRTAIVFLSDYLRMITMGTDNAHEMEALIEEEIETHHTELHRIAKAVEAVADGLPAFGIVAAVLGVITAMGAILEPPEVLGGMIGAALVGTFLGVLLAYGIVGPLGSLLKDHADAQIKYFQCIKAALIAYMQGYAPAMCVEFARKILFSNERPTFAEVEDAVAEATA